MVRRDLSVPRPRDDMSCPSMASTPEAASFILKNFPVWPISISHNAQYHCSLECSLREEGMLVGNFGQVMSPGQSVNLIICLNVSKGG